MSKIINQNILTVTSGVICHQVNLRGVMGGGLALQVRDKWPELFGAYKSECENGVHGLGSVSFVEVSDGLFVANLFAQSNFGRDGRYTDYKALRECLTRVSEFGVRPVYLPFGIGCGLGGGDWNVVYGIIEEVIPWATICKIGR